MSDLDWIFDTGETEYITAYSKSGPGIDLIINEARAFILLGYLTHMLTVLLSPPLTPHCIHQLSSFLPFREITLSAMGPRYPPVGVPQYWSAFIFLISMTSPVSYIFPPVKIFTFFFVSLLSLSKTNAIWEPFFEHPPLFQTPKSPVIIV